MSKYLAFALAAVSASAARADVVVQLDPGPGAQFAQQAGIDLEALRTSLQTEFQELFQTYRLSEFLRSFSDAQSFATRGLGVDYASNGNLMIGFAGNISVNVDEGYNPRTTRSPPPLEGAGTNLTLMAGVNLGFLGLEPLTIYGNYFQRDGSLGDFDGDFRNYGVHAQIKLFGPGKERLVNAFLRWGGFDITTGFDYAKVGLGLGKNFRRDIPVGANVAGARVAFDGTGSFNLNMDTLTIPLELTTNLRLLYILSVYGGVGFDWQLGGDAKLDVDLGGKMTGTAQGASADIGTVRVTASDSAKPSAGRVRALAGVQANFLFIKLFTQVNFTTQDPVLASVAVGARLVF